MHFLLSTAFVLCWSSGFIGAKLGADSAPAVTVLMWRFLPLAVLLLAATAVSRTSWRGLAARDVARQAVIGVLSQSGYLLTVYHAIQLGVSSGTTALIDGVQPLVAGALAGPLLHQYVSRRQWIGLCLGVSGVALVTLADAAAGTGAAWWAYLVPFLGMASLVAATFLESRSRVRVAPAVSLTVHCVASAVVFTALALGAGAAEPPAGLSFWLSITWLVVLPTFGGYGLYWLILRRSGVTEVNTLMFLMAPVTAVWGALMFGEPFGPQTALGLTLGLAAVVVVHRGNPPPTTTAPGGSPRGARPNRSSRSFSRADCASGREPMVSEPAGQALVAGRTRRTTAPAHHAGTGRRPPGISAASRFFRDGHNGHSGRLPGPLGTEKTGRPGGFTAPAVPSDLRVPGGLLRGTS